MRHLTRWFRALLTGSHQQTGHYGREAPFDLDPSTGLRARRYPSYEAYVDHQRQKLHAVGEPIVEHDRQYEEIVFQRYGNLMDWRGKCVLCIGARLGGEVRAFKRLGALAIGIDLEPGGRSEHVLVGDCHKIAFPDSVFDAAFTNVLDHLLDVPVAVGEFARVLKPEGTIYIEVADAPPGNYEAVDLAGPGVVESLLASHFVIKQRLPISTTTNYVSWRGETLCCRRLPERVHCA